MEYYGRSLALVARRLRKGMGVTLVDTFSYFFFGLTGRFTVCHPRLSNKGERACLCMTAVVPYGENHNPRSMLVLVDSH